MPPLPHSALYPSNSAPLLWRSNILVINRSLIPLCHRSYGLQRLPSGCLNCGSAIWSSSRKFYLLYTSIDVL